MSESLKWIKSSYSASGNCVEAAARDHGNRVLVRDTKDRTGPVLRFSPVAWRRFADQVKRSLAPDPTGSADACRGHFRVLRVPLRCAQPRQHDPARARSRYPGAHVLGLAHGDPRPLYRLHRDRTRHTGVGDHHLVVQTGRPPCDVNTRRDTCCPASAHGAHGAVPLPRRCGLNGWSVCLLRAGRSHHQSPEHDGPDTSGRASTSVRGHHGV